MSGGGKKNMKKKSSLLPPHCAVRARYIFHTYMHDAHIHIYIQYRYIFTHTQTYIAGVQYIDTRKYVTHKQSTFLYAKVLIYFTALKRNKIDNRGVDENCKKVFFRHFKIVKETICRFLLL